VPQAMAQFVLKIELLSHIMGTTPILEMARAYGLRPRLWLLPNPNVQMEYVFGHKKTETIFCRKTKGHRKISKSSF